jgi:hypothetical protein
MKNTLSMSVLPPCARQRRLRPAFAQAPVKITLDQAIDLALKHNHTLQAARTTIQQSQAAEITANLRPNPTFFTDWEYLPISPACQASRGGVPARLHRGRHGVELPDRTRQEAAAPPAGSQGRDRRDALAGVR